MSSTLIARKFLSFSIGPVVGAGLALVTTPVVTRLIIPEEYGKGMMFIFAYNMILVFGLLGADQSFIRFFHTTNEGTRKHLLWRSFMVSITATGIVSLALLFLWRPASVLLFGVEAMLHISILCVTSLIGVLFRYSLLVLRMKQRGTVFSLLNLGHSALNALGIILIAVFISRTFIAITVAMLIAVLVPSVFAVILERQEWFGRVRLNSTETSNGNIPRHRVVFDLRTILSFGIPFMFVGIGTWVFEVIDQVALRRFTDFAVLGLYMASFKVVAGLNILRKAFSTFWVPIAYERYAEDPANTGFFERAYLAVFGGMLGVGIVVLLGKDLIVLLLDPAYRDAATIMPFLVLIPIMYTISELTGMGINFAKKTHWHILIVVISAGLNVAGNWILVPVLGARGAAISTGMAYVLFFALRTLISVQYHKVNYYPGRTFVFLGALVAYAAHSTFVPFGFTHIAAGSVLLIAILMIYRISLISVGKAMLGALRSRAKADKRTSGA